MFSRHIDSNGDDGFADGMDIAFDMAWECKQPSVRPALMVDLSSNMLLGPPKGALPAQVRYRCTGGRSLH